MASQSFGAPAARDASRNAGVKGNVSAKSEKPSIGRAVSQPITGKLGDGMSAMPGSKGLGPGVQTVKSLPIVGETPEKGDTRMGNGSLIPGKV